MKKRILSCVLSAALLLGLTPWSALATDDPLDDQTSQTELQTNFQSPPQDPDIYSDPQPNIPVPETPEVQTVPVPAALTAGSVTTEAALRTAVEKGGEVTLGSSIETSSTLVISSGMSVTLNLNGNTLAARFVGHVIKIESGATLTLKDSSSGGTVTHGMGNNNPDYKFQGSGIYVNGGTFNMESGTISDNITTDSGGGVYVEAGTFNMTGGTISGNTAYGNGGGISSDVSLDTKTTSITISDNAMITDNKAAVGGGVLVGSNCTFTMTGGTITKNSALKTGTNYGSDGFHSGGVYLIGTMIVSGTVKITENTQVNDGTAETSNVCAADRIKAKIVIDNDNGGLKSGASIGVSSMATIASGKYTSFITGVTNDNVVNYFTADDDSDYCVARVGSTLALVHATKFVHEHPICGTSCTHTSNTHAGVTWKAINDSTDFQKAEGGNSSNTYYYLNEDITLTETWKPTGHMVLDLNGHSITANGNFNTITVEGGATFTLTDCKGEKGEYGQITHSSDAYGRGVAVNTGTFYLYGGSITGNNSDTGRNATVTGGGVALKGNYGDNSTLFEMYGGAITNNKTTVESSLISADTSGGGVTLTNATFNLYGGDITGNESKLGGGVYVNGDTFSMYGGTISGNTASMYNESGGAGGGVYINSGSFTLSAGTISRNKADGSAGGVRVDGKFTMTGGNITKNSSKYGGGGVYISGPSNTFTMSGGTITGNTAKNGGGVYVYAIAKFNVSGNISITGNKQNSSTEDNVYLYTHAADGAASITINGKLDRAANIGVNISPAPTTTGIKFATGATDENAAEYAEYKDIFKSDVTNKGYYIAKQDTDLYLNPHVHTWNYIVNPNDAKGTTIKATCSDQTEKYPANDGGSIKIKAPENLAYDGSSKTAKIVDTKNFTTWCGPAIDTIPITYEVKQDNTFVKMDANAFPTAVGTYRASISLTGVDGNPATASVEYTISKAPLTADDFTFTAPTASSGQLVYDGKAKAATVTSNKGAAGQITVKYYTEEGSELKGPPTNAGIYTVKIDVTETESYQAATDLTANDWKFTIAKAKQTISVPQDKTLVKNGAGVDISQWVSVSGVEGGSPADKLSYALDGNYHGVTLTGSTLTAEKNATANTVTIKVTAAETQNYERAEATFTVTVAAKSTETLTHVNMTGWPYGGEPNQPSYDPVSDVIDGTLKTTYATKNSDGTNSTFTEKVPTAVGNYTVKVTFETASSVYTGTADFTIKPKPLTTEMVTSIASQTYTGEELSTTATLKDGETVLEAGPDKDYEITGYVDNTNAGTATAIIEGRGNYTGKISVPWTIDRRFLGAPVFSSTVLTKVYDGTTAAATNFDVSYFRDNDPNSSKTYQLTKDTDYKIVRAYYETPDVGDKITVHYALQLTNTNYAFAFYGDYYMGIDGQIAEPGVITQAKQTISVPQDKTLVKNGAGVDISQWVSVSGVEGGSPAGALSYALDGNYSGVTLTGSTLTAAKNTTADTVTIKVTAAATKNYKSAETTFSVKLSDKLPQSNFQFASGLINKTYGDDSFTMTATGAAEGSTVSYESSDTNVATVDENGTVTIVGAGRATITATAAETKDYVSASAAYTLMVARAELTITAKDQSAYIGDKVPELGADSYTVTGLVKGESLTTALTILPTVRYVDENGQQMEPDMTKAGKTVIRASGAAASGNYVIVAFTDGKLTVSARPSSGGGGGSSTPSYPVSTPSKGGNGSVSSNAKNAASGSTVTITVKPDSGYQLETLAVTDHRGNALKLTDQGNGTYTFTMPSGQVDVKATFTQAADETSPFDDVSKDDYYYDAVKWAADSGITGGVGGSLFGSDQSCTRAQIITFLWRAAGSPEPKGAADMTDVPQDAYYVKAIAWAMENGITSGTGADRFSPHAACTRAQGMTFLFRSSKASASGTPAFQDVAADAYYAQAVKWAADNGITSGIGGGLFGPDNGCTRAQIVTFLWKLYAGK